MLFLALVLISLAVTNALPAKKSSDVVETIHYDQQQHAKDTNVRINLNKILIAVLPLEEAIDGLGMGSQMYDDEFSDLTLADLRPPPPPSSELGDLDIEDSDGEDEASTTTDTTQGSTDAPKLPTKSSVQHAVHLRKPDHKIRNVPCTRAAVQAGQCQLQSPKIGLASLLTPLLQRFN